MGPVEEARGQYSRISSDIRALPSWLFLFVRDDVLIFTGGCPQRWSRTTYRQTPLSPANCHYCPLLRWVDPKVPTERSLAMSTLARVALWCRSTWLPAWPTYVQSELLDCDRSIFRWNGRDNWKPPSVPFVLQATYILFFIFHSELPEVVGIVSTSIAGMWRILLIKTLKDDTKLPVTIYLSMFLELDQLMLRFNRGKCFMRNSIHKSYR